MSTATPPPVPAPAKPGPAAKPGFFALPRREFFLGGLAGLAVGKAAEWVQPLEWTQRGMPDGTKLSFAQNAEDLVAAGLLAAVGVDRPSYLDIGAYDPIFSSNTYLFYRQGGRGVLVEPNVGLTPKLRRKRPGDVVLEAGIGIDETAAAPYYVLHDAQLNTFDPEQVERLKAAGARVERVVEMPLVNVNRVIADGFGGAAPDFLSVDVEGLDLAILRTLDFARFRPKVICVETLVTGTLRHNPETPQFLAGKGYEVRGMTHPNTIFVDKQVLGG
ncbi:MAG: FkbM family methyltransferase [Gemmataceae bacterium]|nr:FkbM family methyltransferase [Gemmataceae bacterium]